MTTKTNKAIVRRYIEKVVERGHADLVEEFVTEGFELYGSGIAPGAAALAEWVAMLDSAFPDRQITIDELIAEGDRVVARITLKGTHQGEMQGIPASGKVLTQPSITVFRMVNGKIAEGWFAADNLSTMQQLGVIPAAEAV